MKDIDTIIEGLRVVDQLKTVQRQAEVGDRYESTSEHSFHAVLLADMLAEYYPDGVDVQRVKDLVLYHDLVEVHAGDAALTDTQARKNKELAEKQAFEQLLGEVPNAQRYKQLYHEYEERETIESQIAKKIDLLEVLIQSTNQQRIIKDQGYTEEFLRDAYASMKGDVPIIDELFEKSLTILKEQGKM